MLWQSLNEGRSEHINAFVSFLSKRQPAIFLFKPFGPPSTSSIPSHSIDNPSMRKELAASHWPLKYLYCTLIETWSVLSGWMNKKLSFKLWVEPFHRKRTYFPPQHQARILRAEIFRTFQTCMRKTWPWYNVILQCSSLQASYSSWSSLQGEGGLRHHSLSRPNNEC